MGPPGLPGLEPACRARLVPWDPRVRPGSGAPPVSAAQRVEWDHLGHQGLLGPLADRVFPGPQGHPENPARQADR